MKPGYSIKYEDTPHFREWLKRKGYDWSKMDYWQRQNAFAEEMREGLTEEAERQRRDG